MEEEMERLFFFESARQKAASEYVISPQDTDNLTRWGNALLELAHFQQGDASLTMLNEAQSKLEEALKIEPKKHETLWCLGNVHIAQGFQTTTDPNKAHEMFELATQSFQKAADEDPQNELYAKALQMAGKAPSIYTDMQKQMVSQELAGLSKANASGAKGQNKKKMRKKKNNSDLKYDIMGWAILALGVVGWISMMKVAPPPPTQL